MFAVATVEVVGLRAKLKKGKVAAADQVAAELKTVKTVGEKHEVRVAEVQQEL